MFSPTTYQARRNALASQFSDNGILLFIGNDESAMNYQDNVYRFRQDSSFLYFFGLDRPGLFATIDTATGVATLYGEEMTIEHVIWMGPQLSLAEMAASAGGMQTGSLTQLQDALPAIKNSGRPIHFLPPYRGEHTITITKLLGSSIHKVEHGASEALIKAIITLRSVKSEEELAQLEQACTRTANMHMTGIRTARRGMLESEVMAAVRSVPLSAGADISFPIICSVRGEVLHNHHHDNRLEAGQLLLLDSGGESDFHYAGDMTRTFPVDGTYTQKQAEVYQIVLDSMEKAFSMIRPGVLYRDIHLASARVITEGLQQLGLMTGDVDDSVAQGAHGLFFPHGLGHMIGLDVHDMENLGENLVGYRDGLTRSTQLGLKSLRLAKELEERFVLTVEPGCYFIPALIEQWKSNKEYEQFINYQALEAYYDFGGVRIEDDAVVTSDGYRILGTPAPKTISAVEAMRQEGLA